MTIEEFIRAIPKTETHLHIEGALPYGLLRELDPDRFPDDPDFRRPDYRYADFVQFENLLIEHAMAWYTSPERYYQASKVIFAGLAEQNVKYLETSVHIAMGSFIDADPRDLIAAVKSAAPAGMEVRVIAGLTRDGYTEAMRPHIDAMHGWDELDGIDLHGREWLELESWSAPVWRRCADAGKLLKAHAGEFGGPEKIYEAIDLLGVNRIQHGVRAVEDQALVDRLASEGVVLDVCPLSNEKLRVFSSLEAHSLRALGQAGVRCTISTDDPLCFANTLFDDYFALAERSKFGAKELAAFAKTGFEVARIGDELKRACIQEIDAILKASNL